MWWFGICTFFVAAASLMDVAIAQPEDDVLSPVVGNDHRWGYLSWKENSLVTPVAERTYRIPPSFLRAGPFGSTQIPDGKSPRRIIDQLAPVQLEDSQPYVYIDRSGKTAEIGRFQYASVFSEGRATVKSGDRFQVIDATGRAQFISEFGWIGPYRNNRALIRVGGLYGFVDETGKTVIPAQYDAAESFVSGIAVVRRENEVNFIGTNGEIVFNLPGIETAGSFKGGLAWVKKGGQYGYVQLDGRFLTEVPVPFDRAMPFDGNFAEVATQEKGVGLFNYRGQDVLGDAVNEMWQITGQKFVVNQIVASTGAEYLAITDAGENVLFNKNGEKGEWRLKKLAATVTKASVHVDFKSPIPVEVYRTWIWEYEDAKQADDVLRILTLDKKLGRTQTGRDFSTNDAFAIVFVKDGKVCDVQYWYPDSMNPFEGRCQ